VIELAVFALLVLGPWLLARRVADRWRVRRDRGAMLRCELVFERIRFRVMLADALACDADLRFCQAVAACWIVAARDMR
jgi:hypothetical protein